jgi:signal transduction histidine kinase
MRVDLLRQFAGRALKWPTGYGLATSAMRSDTTQSQSMRTSASTNITAFVGATLVAVYALALALNLGLSDGVPRWHTGAVGAAGGLVLCIFVAIVGAVFEHRRRATQSRRLAAAHKLLDDAAALVDAARPADDFAKRFTLGLLVERLERLVRAVQHLVDERSQREREVMRADQLAMVGQLAAGVAHELRNPLTSIKMLVQSGQKEGAPALAPDDLAIIEHEIRRLERSLQRFLDFARPPRPERRPSDLARVVERALALVEGRARKQRVQLNFSPPSNPVIAEVDEDQIQQLLLNLMLNSLDVMPDGGALSIELNSLPAAKGELRVRDTGPGIPAALLPRLFDPFMSTKETGIGLGLAVSHRIAERHGATLSAHNEPAGGACFVMRFGRLREEPAVA